MKILLHGAINGSNFGDCLFAKQFYEFITKKYTKSDVYFYQHKRYGIGSFLSKELNYTKRYHKKDLRKFDLLIYISGGYFGEREKGFQYAIKRYLRYLIIGEKFVKYRKNIVICGTGAGPIYSNFLKRKIVKVMNHSIRIYLRDKKSRDYLISYGVGKPIEVTSDTALALDFFPLNKLDGNIKKYLNSNKKNILIHLDDSSIVQKSYYYNVVPVLNELKYQECFNLIFTYDHIVNDSKHKYNIVWQGFNASDKIYYHYQSVENLISLISEVDLVITPKLHVGIVATILSKSVISIPLHEEKTKRYYNQINENERCISLSDLSTKVFRKTLENFKDEPVYIPDCLKNLAKRNLTAIDDVLIKHKQ